MDQLYRHVQIYSIIYWFVKQFMPLNFFNFFLVYMCVLILAIYFNKFALCPLNNIIDLFKGYKKIY